MTANAYAALCCFVEVERAALELSLRISIGVSTRRVVDYLPSRNKTNGKLRVPVRPRVVDHGLWIAETVHITTLPLLDNRTNIPSRGSIIACSRTWIALSQFEGKAFESRELENSAMDIYSLQCVKHDVEDIKYYWITIFLAHDSADISSHYWWHFNRMSWRPYCTIFSACNYLFIYFIVSVR